MRALIADDDGTATTLLAAMLKRWGVDAVVAGDGATAWENLQREPALDMALLDWEMPGVDGPELCRRIRRHDALSHMHVILVTARDSRADVITGLDAGADDYLIKPYDLEELRARVHVGLRILALQQRLTERVSELQTAIAKVKQLSGLLPICSYCKRIRSDKDYWEHVESYVAEHTDAQFSHGICPHCYEAVLAQFEA